MLRLFRRRPLPHRSYLAPDLQPCLPGANVLAAGAGPLLPVLRALISAPEAIYQPLYGRTLERCAEFCQNLPVHAHDQPYSLLQQQLARCIAALKIRRGVLLPPQAGAETIAAQEPLWTYAVFTVSLLHGLHTLQTDRTLTVYNAQGERLQHWALSAGTLYEPNAYFKVDWQPAAPLRLTSAVFTSALATRWLTPPIISWLSPVLAVWWEALTTDNPHNPLTALLATAARALTSAVPPASSPPPPPVRTDSSDTAKPSEAVTATVPTPLDPLNTLLDFLQTLAPLRKDVLPATEETAVIYWLRVKGGLLVTEQALQAFLHAYAAHWRTENELLPLLTPHLVLQTNGDYHRQFHSCHFHDARLLTGLVLAETALPTAWRQQPLTTEFQPDLIGFLHNPVSGFSSRRAVGEERSLYEHKHAPHLRNKCGVRGEHRSQPRNDEIKPKTPVMQEV